jgi:hypothetical protein
MLKIQVTNVILTYIKTHRLTVPTWCLPTLAILTRLVSLPPKPETMFALFTALARARSLTLGGNPRSPPCWYLTVADERLAAWCTLGQTKANTMGGLPL